MWQSVMRESDGRLGVSDDGCKNDPASGVKKEWLMKGLP